MERCSLSEMYWKKGAHLRLKLSLKDDLIRELQQDLTKKNLQYELPEVDLQLQTVTENQSEKSGKLVSIVSHLLLNNNKESKH